MLGIFGGTSFVGRCTCNLGFRGLRVKGLAVSPVYARLNTPGPEGFGKCVTPSIPSIRRGLLVALSMGMALTDIINMLQQCSQGAQQMSSPDIAGILQSSRQASGIFKQFSWPLVVLCWWLLHDRQTSVTIAMAAVNSAPPSEELFVTGLPMDCTSELSKQIFSQYGSVKETTVLPVSPGKTAAAGFVVMNSVEDARWIVDHVNGNVPQGLVLTFYFVQYLKDTKQDQILLTRV